MSKYPWDTILLNLRLVFCKYVHNMPCNDLMRNGKKKNYTFSYIIHMIYFSLCSLYTYTYSYARTIHIYTHIHIYTQNPLI